MKILFFIIIFLLSFSAGFLISEKIKTSKRKVVVKKISGNKSNAGQNSEYLNFLNYDGRKQM